MLITTIIIPSSESTGLLLFYKKIHIVTAVERLRHGDIKNGDANANNKQNDRSEKAAQWTWLQQIRS